MGKIEGQKSGWQTLIDNFSGIILIAKIMLQIMLGLKLNNEKLYQFMDEGYIFIN